MRNLFKTILISTLFMLIGILPSSAIVLDNEYLQTKISEDLNNKYQQNNPNGVVIVKNIPSINVDLKGSRLVIDTICNFSSNINHKLAKVLFYENDVLLKTITIPIEIKAYENILVATKDIQRNEALTNNNVKFEKRIVPSNSANLIAENYDFSNMTSKKVFKAGENIDKRYLVKQTAIFRSNPIVAIFQTGGINLSIEVIAMENGGIGDYIKVKSKEYNKIYQGKVINSKKVLIQI